MATATLDKDEKDKEKLEQPDPAAPLRADVLGSIAGADPNSPGYLGKINHLITAHGAVEKMAPNGFVPGSRDYDLSVGATAQPTMSPRRMTAPPVAPDVPNAALDAGGGLPLMQPMKPKQGWLGKIGSVAKRMGNIAGDVLAPGVMMNIPGTDLNKKFETNLTAKRAETERMVAADETKAGAEKERADTEADKERLAREQAGQPKPKEEEWTIAKDYAGPNGEPVEIEKNSGTLRIAGNGISGIKRVNEKPDTETQEAQRYEGIKQAQTLGKPVTPEDQAWAGAYEKRKTLAPFATAVAQAPQKGTERSDKSFQYNNTALDKVSTPVEQAQARMGRLADAIAQNTPQADALIAPELLSVMAGGAGSGLRMNEAEINRIVGGRSNWESLKAAVNKWSLDPKEALSITPEQRREIRALTTEVQKKLTSKQRIIDDARNALIDSDDPKEHRKIVADAKKKMDAIDARESSERKWQKNEKGEYRYSDDGGKTWQNQTK